MNFDQGEDEEATGSTVMLVGPLLFFFLKIRGCILSARFQLSIFSPRGGKEEV